MIEIAWLGRVPYRQAWAMQQDRRDAVLRGEAGEVLWLLEHDPVITTGRRSVPDLDPAALTGLEVVHTERGGLATWHGPGQLVGYLVCDLPCHGLTVKGAVAALEGGVMAWLQALGILAARRAGYPGVWIGSNKVCAVGIHVRRGVTLHGFALNLRADLSGFARIVPCGITDGGVTSLHHVLPDAPHPWSAAASVGAAVVAALVPGSPLAVRMAGTVDMPQGP